MLLCFMSLTMIIVFTACAAFLQDGRADVVANDAGDRVTPAIVAFSENEEVIFFSVDA